MNYFKLLSLALIILSATSCHKKAVVLQPDHCLNERTGPPKNIPGYYGYTPTGKAHVASFNTKNLSKYNYTGPIFNPNNKNEILYIETEYKKNMNRSNKLWKYNFCTEEKTLVAENIMGTYIVDWSVNNWIFFSGYDFQIYKVKPSGDSLTRIRDGVFTTLNSEGTQMLFDDAIRKYFSDANGEIIQALNERNNPTRVGGRQYLWEGDSIFVVQSDSILVYDVKQKTIVDMISKPDMSPFNISGPYRIALLRSANKLLCYRSRKIAEIDLVTHKATVVFDYEGEDEIGQIIGTIDVSSDEKHLVFSKHNYKWLSDTDREVENFIHILDTDWKNDRRVLITE